ncbi:bifunctional folylpolyglutamate synthase/dihydrofolate synthase [Candidatus Margulisiibacteriota bacterium]
MLSYSQTIALLKKQVYRRGINYSLANFSKFLKSIKNPHLSLKNAIHIAGTNGKGSTLSFIAAGLQKAGYKVGTFTSPHLWEYTERICINGKPISKTKFCSIFSALQKNNNISEMLTEFEILTAISFLYFLEKKPDFVIYETGLGGRLDATNVIKAIITIITKIGLDHCEILGGSLSKITREKAGIIKKNTPVIAINQNKTVINILKSAAYNNNAPFITVYPLKKLPQDYLLQGGFQKQNAALAKKSVSLLQLTNKKKEQALSGLSKADFWGRYTKIQKNGQIIILDAAHNPDGIKALINSLKKDYPNSNFIFLIGILKRKEAPDMLTQIFEVSSKTHYCNFAPGTSYPFSEVNQIARNFNYRTIFECNLKNIGKLLSSNNKKTIQIITGSIFFISKMKEVF